jgi:hypothetical protein
LVEEQAGKLYSKDGNAESTNNEQFKALASEYGVTAEMTGNDEHDRETLYKAMAGVEEIPDSLEGNKQELAKAIAEMKVANDTAKKMDDYALRLNKNELTED